MHPSSSRILSVVIPVYNGAATLRPCLQSLFASRFTDFEVIVVDDCSTDGSAEIAAEFPCKVVATPENLGAGPARNAGVKHASGEILYFLDADIVIAPDALDRLVRAFDEHPRYAAIFGSFESAAGPDNFVSVYKNLLHHYTHQHSNPEAITFCSGLGAVRREAFLNIGGFDSQWRFMEDVELGYRLHGAGYRIWLDKAFRSVHLKRYTLVSLIRSDVIARAIPWTRLMLESRQFQNDLNTRWSHVASVPLSFLMLAALPWKSLWLPALTPLLAIFLVLNRGFLGFALRERGVWFALRSVAMCWLGYLYSGIGAVAGMVAYLLSPSKESAAGAEPIASDPLAKAAKSGD